MACFSNKKKDRGSALLRWFRRCFSCFTNTNSGTQFSESSSNSSFRENRVPEPQKEDFNVSFTGPLASQDSSYDTPNSVCQMASFQRGSADSVTNMYGLDSKERNLSEPKYATIKKTRDMGSQTDLMYPSLPLSSSISSSLSASPPPPPPPPPPSQRQEIPKVQKKQAIQSNRSKEEELYSAHKLAHNQELKERVLKRRKAMNYDENDEAE